SPVGQDESRTVAEGLDEAVDVIPAPGVQARGMLPQLVQDFFHLERGEDVLDEHRRLDAAAGNAEGVLSKDEDVVPEAGLEVALNLRQIEVGPGSPIEQRP